MLVGPYLCVHYMEHISSVTRQAVGDPDIYGGSRQSARAIVYNLQEQTKRASQA